LKIDQPRHCQHQQCPGASMSLEKSCKLKSIHQWLGLIQWPERKKSFKKKPNPDTAGTSSAQGPPSH
jgi:hypothetical protein